jgi:hypothetical protein
MRRQDALQGPSGCWLLRLIAAAAAQDKPLHIRQPVTRTLHSANCNYCNRGHCSITASTVMHQLVCGKAM